MPRIEEVQTTLIRALEAHYSSATEDIRAGDFEDDSTLFEHLILVGLRLVAAPQVAASALDALRDAGLLEPGILARTNPLAIDDVLKRARVTMAIKSIRPMQRLAGWLSQEGSTFGQQIAQRSTEAIRDDWRAINGVGHATADALLLYGLRRISYPLDRATYRVLVRHGWLDPTADYDEARLLVERFAQLDQQIEENEVGDAHSQVVVASLLVKLKSWFERLGQDFCRPNQARCDHCPIRSTLPASGPVEVE